MNFNTLISPSNFRPLKFLNPKSFLPPFPIGKSTNTHHHHHHCYHRRIRLITSCIDHNKHGLQPVVVVNNDETSSSDSTIDDAASSYLVGGEVEAEVVAVGEEKRKRRVELEEQSIWNQMKEIVMFTGPVAGMWFCGPLMSLIDTVVIGQSSSLELAALGPAAVVCDYTGYVFMFLSIATSNMVATSLAKQDKNEVQHQISILLFVGLVCGVSMLFFTKVFGEWALTAFTGQKNVHLVPAADTYIQIRGLSWPAVLIGWVAQSASLGMKDSWGPLKALVVASLVNGIGDIFLCSYLGYGIAGAAWATMFSQVISAYMMVDALNKKGYNAFAFSVPSPPELVEIAALAAPAFVTMISRVTFYGLVVYFATSAGTHSVAAHQVMLQTGSMSTIFGGPLSQTAQSFMPELLYGINRSLKKARRLLKSLLIIGWSIGLVSVTVGTIVPWLFPNIFTSDPAIVREMHSVLIPYIIAFSAAPATQTLEGALVAGRELNFLSSSMCVCFALGISLLMIFSNRGFGLRGCWYALVGFQWARFLSALQRLLARDGVLFSDKGDQQERTNLTPAA